MPPSIRAYFTFLLQMPGIVHTVVARVWRRAGLQPHRLERYIRSTDPDFEARAAEIIGLYLNPPPHASVFCVDEKTAIQALDRGIRGCRSRRREPSGRLCMCAMAHLSLYAALETRDGTFLGRTAARHTTDEFVAFLEHIVQTQPPEREVHIIADNLCAHKSGRQHIRASVVRQSLASMAVGGKDRCIQISAPGACAAPFCVAVKAGRDNFRDNRGGNRETCKSRFRLYLAFSSG